MRGSRDTSNGNNVLRTRFCKVVSLLKTPRLRRLDTFEFALGECASTRTTKERYRFVQRVDGENVEVRDSKGEILRVQSSNFDREKKEFGSVFLNLSTRVYEEMETLYSPSHKSTSSNEKLEEEKEEDVAIHGYNVEQDVDLNDEFQRTVYLYADAFSGFSKGVRIV